MKLRRILQKMLVVIEGGKLPCPALLSRCSPFSTFERKDRR